jgi:hypothetical protein
LWEIGVEESAMAAVSTIGSGKRIDERELGSKGFDAKSKDGGMSQDIWARPKE